MKIISTIDYAMSLSNANHGQFAREAPADWTPDRRFIDVKISEEVKPTIHSSARTRSTVPDAVKGAVAQLNKVK